MSEPWPDAVIDAMAERIWRTATNAISEKSAILTFGPIPTWSELKTQTGSRSVAMVARTRGLAVSGLDAVIGLFAQAPEFLG